MFSSFRFIFIRNCFFSASLLALVYRFFSFSSSLTFLSIVCHLHPIPFFNICLCFFAFYWPCPLVCYRRFANSFHSPISAPIFIFQFCFKLEEQNSLINEVEQFLPSSKLGVKLKIRQRRFFWRRTIFYRFCFCLQFWVWH